MTERGPQCRSCRARLERPFVDLGTSPYSNAFLTRAQLLEGEMHWPLTVYVCDECLLVQLPAFEAPDAIFNGSYAYFSSFSASWVAHAKAYADRMRDSLGLGAESLVVEIASNDGYLLRWFHEAGIPVLGIEPSANTAAAAQELGIPTRVEFFGAELATLLSAEGHRANLMAANNVLAHVPDIHDLVEGFRILLADDGVATFEFPHLQRLIELCQFDTIYHEHYSYLSLRAVDRVLEAHGLVVHDVEELPTHGGSLRVHASHRAARRAVSTRVAALHDQERATGLHTVQGYTGFASAVQRVKDELVDFLLSAKREGRRVVGYGAPAKATTLLNYCGVRSDLLEYTVDRSPHKQGMFLPGVRIPILPPERILEDRPDIVWILPWNLKNEIVEQMAEVRAWGGRFVVASPVLEFL